MPRGNGMGPDGMGPMSGRGAGYCAGYGAPGYANMVGGFGRSRAFGYGRGMGRGMGRGRGFGPLAPVAPAGTVPVAGMEMANLERQARFLEDELRSVRGRLDALKGAPGAATEAKET